MAAKSFFHLLRRKEKQLTFTEIMITAMILKHGVHALTRKGLVGGGGAVHIDTG